MISLTCKILLAFTAPAGSSGDPAAAVKAAANSMHHEWGLLGAVVGGLMGLAAILRWIYTNEHRVVSAASLALEQSASVMFIHLILAESKRVFKMADDHLPLALSQAKSTSPQPSRFDHFCKAIRSIPEEELDDRGHYTDVIRESFTRIISENAERLIDTMSAMGTSSANPILNPTGVRFSLEGDGYIRFAEISKFDSQNRRLTCWFHRVWMMIGIFGGLSMIALALCVVAVLPRTDWGETLGTASLWATTGCVVAGLIMLIVAFILQHMVLRRSEKLGDPEKAQRYLDERRRDA